jgi:hypothetical protein
MFALEDETVLFLYCWTFNEMQIPATRDRTARRKRLGIRERRALRAVARSGSVA